MAIKDIPADELIGAVAAELEKKPEFKAPVWSAFVKTGVGRERPPMQPNWWWIRAASVFRKMYLNPGIGVNRLRKEYSNRKNRGHKPEHRRPASGAIIRKIVQQLEVAGFLESVKNKKGNRVVKRKVTKKGSEFLNGVAKRGK